MVQVCSAKNAGKKFFYRFWHRMLQASRYNIRKEYECYEESPSFTLFLRLGRNRYYWIYLYFFFDIYHFISFLQKKSEKLSLYGYIFRNSRFPAGRFNHLIPRIYSDWNDRFFCFGTGYFKR